MTLTLTTHSSDLEAPQRFYPPHGPMNARPAHLVPVPPALPLWSRGVGGRCSPEQLQVVDVVEVTRPHEGRHAVTVAHVGVHLVTVQLALEQ